MTLDEFIQCVLKNAALKDFNDFMLLVKKMHECQTRYFKTRDKAILIGSKQLEASVDKFIAENLHSGEKQE